MSDPGPVAPGVGEGRGGVGSAGVEPDHAVDQAGVPHDDLQRLWAPWRSGYVSGADGGVTDDHGQAGCPFCVLPARDPADDRETLILHRGEGAFVILNAYPYNPGHLMVVPYAHERFVNEVEEDAAVEMWHLARRAAAILHDALDCQGINLGMNLGRAGGAGIAEHVHLHAVPRWGGDTNYISTIGATRILPQALTRVWDVLADAAWG